MLRGEAVGSAEVGCIKGMIGRTVSVMIRRSQSFGFSQGSPRDLRTSRNTRNPRSWRTSARHRNECSAQYPGTCGWWRSEPCLASRANNILFELGELDLLDTEWKDSRFRATVERITVHNDGRLVFTFTNGSEEMVMM